MSEPILEKIKKLIAHETSARKINSAQEADAFAATIQRLINKYNFSDETIAAIKTEASNIDRETLSETEFKEWQQILSSGIAEANSCAMLFTENLSVLVGSINDREIVKSLYDYFEKLCRDLTEKEMSVMRATGFGTIRISYLYVPMNDVYSPRKFDQYRESYINGLATAIATRLIKQNDQAKEEIRKDSEQSTALVVIENKMVKTMDYVEEHFNIEEVCETVTMDDQKAFYAGVFAGEAVALTNKVLDASETCSDHGGDDDSCKICGSDHHMKPEGWTHVVGMDWAKSKLNDIGLEKFMNEYQVRLRDKIIIDDIDDE